VIAEACKGDACQRHGAFRQLGEGEWLVLSEITHPNVGEKSQHTALKIRPSFIQLNENPGIEPFFANWHASCDHGCIGRMIVPSTQVGEIIMFNETSIMHRALAAVGATAMSLAIMVSYFAAPAATYASSVVA
jgi:hypothetical protein